MPKVDIFTKNRVSVGVSTVLKCQGCGNTGVRVGVSLFIDRSPKYP